MKTENSWSIVLVPRPLTPFTAFAWYVFSELLPKGSLVHDKRFLKWVRDYGSRCELYSKHGIVFNLNARRSILESELLKWLQRGRRFCLVGVPEDLDKRTRVVRAFVSQGHRSEIESNNNWPLWEEWFSKLSKIEDSETALSFSNRLFRFLINDSVDPRISSTEFPQIPPVDALPDPPDIPGVHSVTIPFVKKRGVADSITEHREVTDFSIKCLPKANLFHLASQRIFLVIGGPSGSGKSTLVASLVVEFNNIITSFVSDGGEHAKLRLNVDKAMLDAGTQTTDAIMNHAGQDREMLDLRKKNWTVELASQAVADSERILKTTNLVIGDLPGKLTEITELLSTHAMFGGIVTNDWSQIRAWRDYFDDMGIPIVFEMKSTDATSLITTYVPGRKVMGRINGLNRIVKGWDSSIRLLAELLAFDILPNVTDSSGKLVSNKTLPTEDDQQTIN